MPNINTSIIIHAPVKKIWQVLTDFHSYPQWNPFVTNIQGKLALHEPLKVTIQPPGKKAMGFKAKIISLINERELEWRGGLAIPGIFEGRHKFLLSEIDENKVQLDHSEIFSGILINLIFPKIKDTTQQGFEQMNVALKQRCER